MRVAEQLSQTLQSYGTEVFFQLTGGDQALWYGLRRAGIKMVLCRTEQGAAYMADGYARITGRAAFAYGQQGPGAANIASALADAYWAHSPVVAITSAVPTHAVGRYAYQEIDQLTLYTPVTKWRQIVNRPERVAELTRSAIRAATSPTPGPVHLEIPRDIFAGETDIPIDCTFGPDTEHRPSPSVDEVRQIVDLLARSQRPVILAGRGTILSGAWDQLEGVATAWGVPVATTIGGKGSIAETHPMAIGNAGRYSRRVTNEILAESDFVLVLGSRLGSLATSDYTIPNPDAVICRVDIDPSTFGVTYRETVSVMADIRELLRGLGDMAQPAPEKTAWVQAVQGRLGAWRDAVATTLEVTQDDERIHPAQVVKALNSHISESDILVADTGFMAAWAGALFEVKQPGRNFLRAAGSLGWAIPGALGAQLAAPDRRVVALTGDGGIGYNIMEIETAVRHQLPLVVVVLNNGTLAFEYHEQKHLWGDDIVPEANDFTDVDYGKVARALGARGVRVTQASDLPSALTDALASQEPTVIDVIVDREALAPVSNFDAHVSRVI